MKTGKTVHQSRTALLWQSDYAIPTNAALVVLVIIVFAGGCAIPPASKATTNQLGSLGTVEYSSRCLGQDSIDADDAQTDLMTLGFSHLFTGPMKCAFTGDTVLGPAAYLVAILPPFYCVSCNSYAEVSGSTAPPWEGDTTEDARNASWCLGDNSYYTTYNSDKETFEIGVSSGPDSGDRYCDVSSDDVRWPFAADRIQAFAIGSKSPKADEALQTPAGIYTITYREYPDEAARSALHDEVISAALKGADKYADKISTGIANATEGSVKESLGDRPVEQLSPEKFGATFKPLCEEIARQKAETAWKQATTDEKWKDELIRRKNALEQQYQTAANYVVAHRVEWKQQREAAAAKAEQLRKEEADLAAQQAAQAAAYAKWQADHPCQYSCQMKQSACGSSCDADAQKCQGRQGLCGAQLQACRANCQVPVDAAIGADNGNAETSHAVTVAQSQFRACLETCNVDFDQCLNNNACSGGNSCKSSCAAAVIDCQRQCP